jgi:hypothetical protein
VRKKVALTTLTCGGRGPCCHVGYPHRHCEHCDVVVATQTCHHVQWPNQRTWFGSYGLSQNTSPLQALEAQFNHVDYPDK